MGAIGLAVAFLAITLLKASLCFGTRSGPALSCMALAVHVSRLATRVIVILVTSVSVCIAVVAIIAMVRIPCTALEGLVLSQVLVSIAIARDVTGVPVAHFQVGRDAGTSGKHVLGYDAAVAYDVVLVDVGGFALTGDLDGALAACVVGVTAFFAVVVDLADAVVFIPQDDAAGAVVVVAPAGLVAVGIIGEGAVPDVGGGVRLCSGEGDGLDRASPGPSSCGLLKSGCRRAARSNRFYIIRRSLLRGGHIVMGNQ